MYIYCAILYIIHMSYIYKSYVHICVHKCTYICINKAHLPPQGPRPQATGSVPRARAPEPRNNSSGPRPIRAPGEERPINK